MNFDIDEIAAELEDGDKHVVETDDGTWTFTLSIDHDEVGVSEMEDPEVFGRYECRRYLDRDRPDGFTGAAVKLQDDANQGYYYWYEPPADLRRFKGSGFATIEEWEKAKAANLMYVRNLLSWGYISVTVQVHHERADGYERTWDDSLGGIESSIGLSGEALTQHVSYIREVVKEQIAEALAQVTA